MNDPKWVFDCSAIMALVLGDQQGDEAEAVLRQAIEAGDRLIVPGLFWFEVANTLVMAEREGRLNREELRLAESDLAGLPIDSEGPPDAFLRERIRELARDYRLTAYDAAYLECAQRNGRRLKTFDRDLLGLRDRFEFIS